MYMLKVFYANEIYAQLSLGVGDKCSGNDVEFANYMKSNSTRSERNGNARLTSDSVISLAQERIKYWFGRQNSLADESPQYPPNTLPYTESPQYPTQAKN